MQSQRASPSLTQTLNMLTVLTYNVNFGSFWDENPSDEVPHAAQRVAQAIQLADADVVCLQETNIGWERYLSAVLKDLYPFQVWERPNQYYYASGSATLCKPTVRLVEGRGVPTGVPGSFFSGQVVHVQIPLGSHCENGGVDEHLDGEKNGGGNGVSGSGGGGVRDVVFVNVHLRPPLAMGNEGGMMNNMKAYLIESGPIHSQEVEALVRYSAQWVPNATPILLGDFNEGSWGTAVCGLKVPPPPPQKNGGWFGWAQGIKRKAVCGGGWLNAVDSVVGSKTTWHWPLKGGVSLTGSYDHIFFKPNQFALQNCKIFDQFKDASDHLPVRAEFRF